MKVIQAKYGESHVIGKILIGYYADNAIVLQPKNFAVKFCLFYAKCLYIGIGGLNLQ